MPAHKWTWSLGSPGETIVSNAKLGCAQCVSRKRPSLNSDAKCNIPAL